MNFKVCSCPKRDKDKEEKSLKEKQDAVQNGQPIPAGKRRMTTGNAHRCPYNSILYVFLLLCVFFFYRSTRKKVAQEIVFTGG